MPKQIAQDVARQVKQIGEEVVKETIKQPGEMAGQVLEQLGVTPPTGGAGRKQVADSQKAKLVQMEVEDKAKSEEQIARLKKGLEEEMKKSRLKREEELRQRREQPAEAKAQAKPLTEVSSKPKRGLWRRRIQRAEEKARPEKVGRRIAG